MASLCGRHVLRLHAQQLGQGVEVGVAGHQQRRVLNRFESGPCQGLPARYEGDSS